MEEKEPGEDPPTCPGTAARSGSRKSVGTRAGAELAPGAARVAAASPGNLQRRDRHLQTPRAASNGEPGRASANQRRAGSAANGRRCRRPDPRNRGEAAGINSPGSAPGAGARAGARASGPGGQSAEPRSYHCWGGEAGPRVTGRAQRRSPRLQPRFGVFGAAPLPLFPGSGPSGLAPTVDPRPDGPRCQRSLEAKAVSAGHVRLTYWTGLVGSSSGVWLPAGREGGRGARWRQRERGLIARSNPEKAGRARAERSLGLGYTAPTSGGEILRFWPPAPAHESRKKF